MRKLLDGIYNSAAALAALFMVGLLVMVLLSIVSRQLHFHVPGTDAYAGYLMAASGFLALAHTLKRGEHIRVTLLINTLAGRWKKSMEVWALALATLLALLFAFLHGDLFADHFQLGIFLRHFTQYRFNVGPELRFLKIELGGVYPAYDDICRKGHAFLHHE